MEKPARQKYPSVTQMTDAEHIRVVREIFSTITEKYDFLNHFLSLWQDIAWRRSAARKMYFFQTHRFLDVATGTADMAIEAAQVHSRIRVIAVDFMREMMDLGRAKIERRHLSDRIQLLMSDALHLPLHDNSFDVAGIAFGIRNIPNKVCVLREMNRVVVPGGQVMVLEMTVPPNRLLKGIYRTYLNRMMPTLARAFSPNPVAYRYLADSIRHFPAAEDFIRLMGQAGITMVKMFPLTLGITHLYVGTKVL